MPGPTARRVIVVGAGALGSSIALILAQGGARVRLIDCAAPGDNASGVAAGMLAPAFEAMLDPLSSDHFALLRDARDLWPDFVGRLESDVGLRRCGAIWLSGDADPEACALGLSRLGARAERLSAGAARAAAPDLGPNAGEGVFTPDDWRLDAAAALSGIVRAAGRAGVETITGKLVAIEAETTGVLQDGRRLEADAIVLATGAGRAPLAPELAHLSPIKGHILQYAWPSAASPSPILRCSGGYGVVGAGVVRVGATMQAGRDDRHIEPQVVAQLHALAVRLFPALEPAKANAAAGVRAATPDGLPLVGPSSLPGVFLAAGARRNGWLLAPMVATMTAAYLAGGDAGPRAALFDPRRFD